MQGDLFVGVEEEMKILAEVKRLRAVKKSWLLRQESQKGRALGRIAPGLMKIPEEF